ncbi:MAG: hypothetical protein R3B47_21645 [Bacteroidia bacterium]
MIKWAKEVVEGIRSLELGAQAAIQLKVLKFLVLLIDARSWVYAKTFKALMTLL